MTFHHIWGSFDICDTLKLRPKGHYLFVGRLVRDIAYLESQ